MYRRVYRHGIWVSDLKEKRVTHPLNPRVCGGLIVFNNVKDVKDFNDVNDFKVLKSPLSLRLFCFGTVYDDSGIIGNRHILPILPIIPIAPGSSPFLYRAAPNICLLSHQVCSKTY